MVLLQNVHFSNFFFLGNMRQEMSFRIFQNQKTPFQAIKTRSSKTRKIKIFPKGFCPWFQSKNGSFSNFFSLDDIGQSNIFYDILERKYAFLGYKNKTLKNSKNSHFPKGVNPWFSYKNGLYPNFFFCQYRPGKCLLLYSRTKKTPFQAINTKSSKSQKNGDFPKGVNPWFWSKNGHFSSFFFYAAYASKMSFTIFQNEKTPF